MLDYRIGAGNPDHLGVTKHGKDINFAVVVQSTEACSLLLYEKGSPKIAAEIPFMEEMRFGDICAMEISRFPIEKYEYNYKIGEEVVQDPYARRIVGRETWGTLPKDLHGIRCGAQFERFSWQNGKRPGLAYEDCVLYVTHVRGFTMDPSSKVRHPGTFAGIREKIPYLKNLGINQLELMPVYEFAELEAEKVCKKHRPVHKDRGRKLNYWGYGPACYFAPKAAYSAGKDPVREFKELVRELHKNGIELILEFYFPEKTPPYLVQDCIRYWVSEYQIDGVHVNSKGTHLEELAMNPWLSGTKLMSEYFPLEESHDPDDLLTRRRLGEYNDDFLLKARRFLRGDENTLEQIAWSMRRNPKEQAVINYIAGHNGYTLADLVSYEGKHNEANGEENQDGSNYNYSCNYGEEGPASTKKLEQLRRRQMRNAFLLLFLSQGVPAIYGGDEMGNSQGGNNNAWCQDNETSWVQWSRSRADRRLLSFVKDAIAFRKEHPAFGRRTAYVGKDYLSKGMPDLSYHGKEAWYEALEGYNRQMGILYAGCYTGGETCYVALNMHTIPHELALPTLPKGERWHVAADTGRETETFYKKGEEPLLENQKLAAVPPRTILILTGKKDANQTDKYMETFLYHHRA